MRLRCGVAVVVAACGNVPERVPPRPLAAITRPLAFERGDGDARYVVRGDGFTVFLTDAGAVVATGDGALQLSAGTARAVIAMEPQRTEVHYLLGNDPDRWRTAATYAAVKYEQVFEGIDLIFHGHQRELEYDFVVAQRADPDRIALAIEPADRIAIDGGDVVIEVAGRELRHHQPVAYQDIGGRREDVDVAYELRGGVLGFRVGAYDPDRELVIDPVITYSTYLGGNQGDSGNAIAVDTGGNIYVTGTTTLNAFPTKNPLQPADLGNTNTAFVAKLDASGALVYSTYLGGSGGEVGNAIAVDAAGNAYVAGTTLSSDFPRKNAAQNTSGGMPDGFVAVLDPTGGSLVYSTYLGGTTTDALVGLAIDAAGNAYVCGVTDGAFPTTTGAVQKNFGGNQDGFVVKLAPAGTITYATYIGGSGFDSASGIAADSSGNAYVTGQTDSVNLPTHAAFQGARAGGVDAFVAELAPSGAAYVYSTYLGGTGDDTGVAIAVDATGRAYVAGDSSGNFPTTTGAYQRTYGGGTFDMFVARIAAAGASLDYATYLGGPGNDFVHGIAVDAANDAYIAGSADASFPTMMPIQAFGGGAIDATLSELDAAGATLTFSTFLGGTSTELAEGVAIDSAGAFYVVGSTASTDLPIIGGLQPTYGGGTGDVFIATNRTTAARDFSEPGDDAGVGGGTPPGGCCDAGHEPDVIAILAVLVLIPRRRRRP